MAFYWTNCTSATGHKYLSIGLCNQNVFYKFLRKQNWKRTPVCGFKKLNKSFKKLQKLQKDKIAFQEKGKEFPARSEKSYQTSKAVVVELIKGLQINTNKIEELIDSNNLTHVFAVYCETTSGILNPIEEIAKLVEMKNLSLFIDAMSAFGALPLSSKIITFDAVATASKVIILELKGNAPKALIASMNSDKFFISTNFAISSIGFKIPDVVSQYTAKTCVKLLLSINSSILFVFICKPLINSTTTAFEV